LIIKFGLFLAITSFAFSIFYFLRYLKGDIEVEGYTSLIISIWMVSGFILSTLGIIGLYVGKTFETVKLRPLFLIDETLNISDED
jgi:dolichol-phosphate mannosyltransferase